LRRQQEDARNAGMIFPVQSDVAVGIGHGHVISNGEDLPCIVDRNRR
jgi:hypothetical protein